MGWSGKQTYILKACGSAHRTKTRRLKSANQTTLQFEEEKCSEENLMRFVKVFRALATGDSCDLWLPKLPNVRMHCVCAFFLSRHRAENRIASLTAGNWIKLALFSLSSMAYPKKNLRLRHLIARYSTMFSMPNRYIQKHRTREKNNVQQNEKWCDKCHFASSYAVACTAHSMWNILCGTDFICK